MKIIDINWLSKSAKEAEVIISDGIYSLSVFSQPCDYAKNQEINDCIHPLEVKNFRKSYEQITTIEKLTDSYFGYRIIGVLDNIDNAILSVGKIKLELNVLIPSWAQEGDYIEFESLRFDLW